MTEIKPVYQLKMGNGSWIDQERVSYDYNVKYGHESRILYPAAAYEAKCNEVAQLQKENAEQAKEIKSLQDQIGWISILDEDDAMHESILARAKQSYMRHKYSARGQQITKSDDLETHIIWAAFEYKEAAQAKRIEEHIELIEATAEFSKAFWEKADKHSDTRVMVSTFQQLERKLRTYLPASKNGE